MKHLFDQDSTRVYASSCSECSIRCSITCAVGCGGSCKGHCDMSCADECRLGPGMY